MSKKPTIEESLSGELVLAKGVNIVDIGTLPPSLQEQLEAEDGDRLISKSSARERSKVIDSEFAALLSRFEEPQMFLSVVRAYAKEQNESATTLLESFLEPCIGMIAEGYLRSTLEEEDNEETPVGEDATFGEYKTIYKVHQTEDTELYLAEDKSGTFVALKIGKPQNSDMIMALLKSEINVLESLPEGIAPKLLHVNLEGKFPYIVTEWVEGVLVSQYAQKLRVEKNRDALVALMASIVKRYTMLHKAGWLHQDIHPGNMMVDDRGEVRLIDFGLSQPLISPHQVRAGIHAYMAPESIEGGKKINNVASEQYSVATVMYELFTGSPYINFSLRTERMYEQLKGDAPRAFSELSVEPFPTLEKIFAQALAKEPDERFENLSLLHNALTSIAPEGRAKREDKQSQGHKFSSELFQAFHEEGVLYQEGLPSGPRVTLFYGEAGVAYAMYRYALVEESAYYLSLAERWIRKALSHISEEDAFVNPTFDEMGDLNMDDSTYNSEIGLYGVQAFIAYAKGDFRQVNQSIRMILEKFEPKVGRDLTLDSLSVALLSIHLLHRDVGKVIDLSYKEEMERRVELIVDGLLKEPQSATFSLELKEKNLGIAHGEAGHLYVLLKWAAYKKVALGELFFDKLDRLLALKIPYGRGSCIPWQSVGQQHFNTMSGWCNGSAGVVMLLCEVVKITKREAYLKMAEKFALHCWEDVATTANLCCGLAGRAYALAYYGEVTADTLWHNRALLLLERAVEEVVNIDTQEMPKHSLYKGQLGVALALEEIEKLNLYSMPFFGSEL